MTRVNKKVALAIFLAVAFLIPALIPEMALAADGSAEPYSRAALWVGAIIYTACVLIAVFIGFSGRFNRRAQGTVHEDLWRNYGGRGGENHEMDR